MLKPKIIHLIKNRKYKKYIIKVIYSRELTDKNGKTVGAWGRGGPAGEEPVYVWGEGEGLSEAWGEGTAGIYGVS